MSKNDNPQNDNQVTNYNTPDTELTATELLDPDQAKHNLLLERIKAQSDYCSKNSLPHFAPSNGKCFKCSRQIYNVISLELASSALITDCPYCHASYCS